MSRPGLPRTYTKQGSPPSFTDCGARNQAARSRLGGFMPHDVVTQCLGRHVAEPTNVDRLDFTCGDELKERASADLEQPRPLQPLEAQCSEYLGCPRRDHVAGCPASKPVRWNRWQSWNASSGRVSDVRPRGLVQEGGQVPQESRASRFKWPRSPGLRPEPRSEALAQKAAVRATDRAPGSVVNGVREVRADRSRTWCQWFGTTGLGIAAFEGTPFSVGLLGLSS